MACRISHVLVLVIGVLLICSPAAADTVQLTNGDTLSGEVVSLDARQLKIKSSLLGEIVIARGSVQSITLGEAATRPSAHSAAAKPAPAAEPAAKPAAAASPLSVEDILKQLGTPPAPGSLAERDLRKQLQLGGITPAEIEKLKQQLPLLAAPEVQNYFRKTIGGLADGSLSINDIRNEAIRARDETREAIKDLGPEAERVLSGYLGILDHFIKETEPKPPAPSSAKP
jgi:hypothetical protein